jgi:hypothetical protein
MISAFPPAHASPSICYEPSMHGRVLSALASYSSPVLDGRYYDTTARHSFWRPFGHMYCPPDLPTGPTRGGANGSRSRPCWRHLMCDIASPPRDDSLSVRHVAPRCIADFLLGPRQEHSTRRRAGTAFPPFRKRIGDLRGRRYDCGLARQHAALFETRNSSFDGRGAY